MIADGCGAGHDETGQRTLDQLRFMGDAVITDEASFCAAIAERG